jgi:hypothetical protein
LLTFKKLPHLSGKGPLDYGAVMELGSLGIKFMENLSWFLPVKLLP